MKPWFNIIFTIYDFVNTESNCIRISFEITEFRYHFFLLFNYLVRNSDLIFFFNHLVWFTFFILLLFYSPITLNVIYGNFSHSLFTSTTKHFLQTCNRLESVLVSFRQYLILTYFYLCIDFYLVLNFQYSVIVLF